MSSLCSEWVTDHETVMWCLQCVVHSNIPQYPPVISNVLIRSIQTNVHTQAAVSPSQANHSMLTVATESTDPHHMAPYHQPLHCMSSSPHSISKSLSTISSPTQHPHHPQPRPPPPPPALPTPSPPSPSPSTLAHRRSTNWTISIFDWPITFICIRNVCAGVVTTALSV